VHTPALSSDPSTELEESVISTPNPSQDDNAETELYTAQSGGFSYPCPLCHKVFEKRHQLK
jgi:hypothetical protein